MLLEGIGGEEFLIVLPDTDLEEAWKIFERIRKRVENLSFNQGRINITVSAGVSLFK